MSADSCRADFSLVSGGHPRAKAPLVLGNEGAGIIEDPGGSGLAVGSRVMFTGPYGVRESGAWEEWLLARPEDLTFVPEAIGDVVAASLPVAYLTAQITLTLAGFKPGKTVLAPAIGGSVGNATYQLARAQGAGKVISTAGSAAKAVSAHELGFENVIDLTTEGLADGVRRITAGKGVDIAIDSVGGAEQPWSRRRLAHVGLFRRTKNHDRCDRPDLERRADGWLLAVPTRSRRARLEQLERTCRRSPTDPGS
jgi:NADPH:quinone reductase-like Zn-dependent oxidoreductase